MNVFVCLVLCFSCVYGSNSNLLSVLLVYRHGDRSPTDFTPKDVYKDQIYWRTEPGELSNRGKQQHYALGAWLRKRYQDFLPNSYHKSDIYVRSSATDRCLMSAAANLAGLYPPAGDQVWNSDIRWMPIPIHSVPNEDDGLLKMGKACPNFQPKFKDLLSNENFTAIDENNKELYKFLSENTGEKVKKFRDVERIYDTLTIEAEYNLRLPDWTQQKLSNGVKVFPDAMQPWANLAFKVPTYTQELARLGTGRFFDTVASQFDAVINNDTENMLAQKMVMFSAHKSTVSDLTNTLGNFRTVPYAGCLIFELRKYPDSQKKYVNTVFKSGEEVELFEVQGCEIDCPYSKFQQILKPYRLSEAQWNEECGSAGSVFVISSSLITVWVIFTMLTNGSLG